MDGHTRTRVAVVNDDPAFLAIVEEILESSGSYEVFVFRDADTSLAELRATRPRLLLVDILTAEVPSGWELALLAGADHELGPVPIVVTSPAVPALGRRVEELHEVANIRVLSKPFTTEQLRRVVHEAVFGTGRAERELHEPI